MDARTLYRPAPFFLIAFLVSWTFWLTGAYLSWHGGSEALLAFLMFLGLSGPAVAALVMFSRQGSPESWGKYRDRLFNLQRIDPRMYPLILFLVPALICVAIGISLFFGGSADQFAILPGAAFLTLPGLAGIFLAPALEEAGWRGYGVDSLRGRSTLFAASVAFGIIWACWHIPLFFFKGFYHNTLLASWLFTANFFVSVFAMAFLLNHVFYRNNRSVAACFLFHLSANVSMSFIPASPETRCIVTLLLLACAAAGVIADRDLFFTGSHTRTGD